MTKELAYFTAQVPVLFLPVPDQVVLWKKNLFSRFPESFENLTQDQLTPELWYLAS